jgi:hypothetical protein
MKKQITLFLTILVITMPIFALSSGEDPNANEGYSGAAAVEIQKFIPPDNTNCDTCHVTQLSNRNVNTNPQQYRQGSTEQIIKSGKGEP